MKWQRSAKRVRRRLRRARQRMIGSSASTADPAGTSFFSGLGPALPEVPGNRTPNVLVLAGPQTYDLGQVLDSLGSARVRVLSPQALPEWRLHQRDIAHIQVERASKITWHARRFGPYDAIINLLPAAEQNQFALFRRLFLHLRADGRYLLDRRVVDDDDWAELLTALHQLGPYGDSHPESSPEVADPTEPEQDSEHGGEGPEQPPPATGESELSRAVAAIAVDRRALLVVKRLDHWLKLRNEQADRFLVTRNERSDSRLMHSQRAGTFTSRAELHLHEYNQQPEDFPVDFEYPALYLHEYTPDVTLASHSLLFTEHTVLPESFRYQQVPVLHNSRLIESPLSWGEKKPRPWTGDFARVPDNLRAERLLEGHYYHLDCPYPGHFGHLMTEVVSRLWGWDQAKAEIPDLKAIMRVYRPDQIPRLEQALFTAYGIDSADLVWTGGPVRLQSVVGATPMWQNSRPHYVHPDILQTWQRLGDRLILPRQKTPEKLFVSRKLVGRRECRNLDEVDAYFADRGYHVIYPETMDLAEQATLFAGAKVVAGYGGSGMFNIAYARRLEKVIVLTHESYTARNEYLYASVLGCELHYLWSDPDQRHPAGTWSQAAFRSGWEFDFARNRSILDRIS